VAQNAQHNQHAPRHINAIQRLPVERHSQ
jgi:hypothetical protein